MTTLLRDIAYVRAGDKGASVSIGVIAQNSAYYPSICRTLKPAVVKAHFGDWIDGEVEVFEMPNIEACLVLLKRMKGGGATNTLRFDATSKALGTAILRLPVSEQ